MHNQTHSVAKEVDLDMHDSTVSTPKSHGSAPSLAELDAIKLSTYESYDSGERDMPPVGHAIEAEKCKPRTIEHAKNVDNDLESGRPHTPASDEGIHLNPTWKYPSMNKWRLLACCVTYFGNGMNDSAPGPLIPYLEKWYHIGYAIVSLIFISNALGFILAACIADPLLARLGRSRTLMLSELGMIAGYVIIACTPPFAVVVVAYLILGFGNAINLAMNNVFCNNLSNPIIILGLAHGSYGVGGIVAPIIVTSLVSHGVHWARFYLITIGVRAICFVLSGWSFHGYEREPTTQAQYDLTRTISTQTGSEPSKLKLLGRALRNKVTIVGAIFIFAYQGAEVSESGWFISYLLSERHGDPAKVGYVTSGFWGGITLGRFVLTHVAQRVGEKRFVYAMLVGCIALQVVAWQVPNVIGDSVAVALLGLMLGPVYPCAQTVFTKLLPFNLQMIAISFISSAGSSGGAVVPFLTGLIAQSAGTYVLHPICISFFTLSFTMWLLLRHRAKK